MVTGSSAPRRKGKKSAPPSRLRYEKANPAVTVRISSELRAKLAELKETHNLSLGDVLRIGMEKAKPDLDAAYERGREEAYQEEYQAYSEGYEEGYEEAKMEYEVTYWCSRCRRRHMTITTDEEKKAAAQLMYDAGWHSTACS